MQVKIKDILLLLSDLDPEENVLMIMATKEEFDYNEDDEVTLTQEAWDRIVLEYETGEEYHNLYESVGVAVAEYAEAIDEDE